MRPVTLGDLRRLDVLAGAQLLAPIGTDPRVTEIDLVEAHQVLTHPLRQRSAAVLALDAAKGSSQVHLLQVLIHRAKAARLSAVIVTGMSAEDCSATRSLITRLDVPVVFAAPEQSALELVICLRSTVLTPELMAGNDLRNLARRLSEGTRSLDQSVKLVAKTLSATVGVCTDQGSVVAGAAAKTESATITAVTSRTAFRVDTRSVAVLPVPGPSGSTALWLVAERNDAGALWRELAVDALTLIRGEALSWLAGKRLSIQQSGRVQAGLLTELIARQDAVPQTVEEQVLAIGWRIRGWHTGIHFRFRKTDAMTTIVVETLSAELARPPLSLSPLVERPDGWATWITVVEEPAPGYIERVAQTLAKRLANIRTRQPKFDCAVGVGAPQHDLPGLADTLDQARQAAAIASGDSTPVAIRVAQDLGAARLLFGWYSSEAFRDHAYKLLAPLLDPPQSELLSTLETYLDRACSVVPTARALAVHRNTVSARIAKIEMMLGTPLSHTDTRLILQLALRSVRTSAATHDGSGPSHSDGPAYG